LTHTLVAELLTSDKVRMGALQAASYSINLVMYSLASCRTAQSDVYERGRETQASPRLHSAACIFGRWTGRVEHHAGALRNSNMDTFDQISRDDGVEGH